MKCIVPLAGPDLFSEKFGFRPLIEVDGRCLIEAALKGRPWAHKLSGEDFIFVLRNVGGVETVVEFLEATWPGCRTVMLSHLTGGALLSVLAASGLVKPDEAIIVDLADILFSEGPADPEVLLRDFNAVVPVFQSREPVYSYLRTEGQAVVEAREKVVISDNASAGVYIFESLQLFLRAAAHSIANRETLSFKGMLFVCPTINGVIADGGKVSIPRIYKYNPVSKLFH